MTHLIFVYGTLKQGFRNFHVNDGERVPGEYETVERYPLYVVGTRFIPWLVDRRGSDHHVAGELYEVSAETLARLDEFEGVGEPGWYSRCDVWVRPRSSSDGESIAAQVYFGSPTALETEEVHLGPIAEFTVEHDAWIHLTPSAD